MATGFAPSPTQPWLTQRDTAGCFPATVKLPDCHLNEFKRLSHWGSVLYLAATGEDIAFAKECARIRESLARRVNHTRACMCVAIMTPFSHLSFFHPGLSTTIPSLSYFTIITHGVVGGGGLASGVRWSRVRERVRRKKIKEGTG